MKTSNEEIITYTEKQTFPQSHPKKSKKRKSNGKSRTIIKKCIDPQSLACCYSTVFKAEFNPSYASRNVQTSAFLTLQLKRHSLLHCHINTFRQ